MTATSKCRYFVRRLNRRDYRPSPNAEFIVEVLTDPGPATIFAYIANDSDEVVAIIHAMNGRLSVENHGIPLPVIEVARQMHGEFGEYVDENGRVIQPLFLPPISE